MGDKEGKVQYTPEELKEIDRIITSVTAVDTVQTPHAEKTSTYLDSEPEEEEQEGDTIEDLMLEPVDEEEPEDLDITEDEFEEPSVKTEKKKTADTDYIPEGLDIDITDIEPLDQGDEGSLDLESVPGALKDEGLDEIQDQEIEDISDLIHEVEEPGEEETFEDLSLEDIEAVPDLEPLSEEIPGISGEKEFEEEEFKLGDFEETAGEEEEEVRVPEEKISSRERSPLDQLQDLTMDEPESVDVQEMSDERFVDTQGPGKTAVEDIEFNLPEFEEKPVKGEGKKPKEEVSLDKDIEADIPDLSDISMEDAAEIPEAAESDIPDLELDEIGAVEDIPGKADLQMPVENTGDMDISDISAIAGGPGRKDMDTGDEDALNLDLHDDLAEIPTGRGLKDEKFDDIEPLSIEPMDEEEEEPVRSREKAGAESAGLDLSDSELKKLKKAIILFNPAVIRAVKEAVINDLMPVKDTRQLIDMIISGKPESNIQRFLEKKLDRKIDLVDETPSGGRRVITARPEYTKEGRERQKKLLKLTRVFGIAAVVAFLMTILGYQFVYKPLMAKKRIKEGVSIILSSGDYTKKPRDYQEAEEIFRYVDQNYAKDYLYGYNAYGKAYFEKTEYERALAKFDKAYSLNGAHVETLNSLGYFYSRVPAEFYMTVKNEVSDKYYRGKKLAEIDRQQLNVAINFFKRSLVLDRDNVSALYGIGNAYYYQGQFLTAKKYYEDILRVDKDSVVGYSGLLNLYIERDSYTDVATLFNQVSRKDMLHDLPSPLLGNLAEYFLNKRRKPGSNVRIDYGVVSPKLKDLDDNTYPAVSQVLKELNKRDSSYPPLQVHYARLNRAQNNFPVMKRHLEKAVGLAPNYFDALHALGEFYYDTKEPVKAYDFLSKAVKAAGNRPDFAREDFYKQIYNPGESQALLGNIFYYYFDRVRFTFGDLQDEMVDKDIEKLANYNIAREKYELALKDKYESPELHYNLGRIYYMNRLYNRALEQWLHLYEDFVRRPELMMALGNAFYHLGNLQAGKGEYLKLISVLEYEVENIRTVNPGLISHVRIFSTLSSVYNNLGAIYHSQENDSRSSISYWKSIDYAQRINTENQFARVNMAGSYKPEKKFEPIIDESIPYSIDIYREDMR